LAVWFICTKLLLRWGSFLGRRIRSLLLVVPLVVPASALSLSYAVGYLQSLHVSNRLLDARGLRSYTAAPVAYFKLVQPPASPGIDPALALTVVGLVALLAGAVIFVSTILFGGRIARRAFGVVLMESEDYPEVQKEVSLVSSRLGISPPRVGLVEDLRPNAFSLGGRGEATIVFSLGMLNLLDGDELEAVISHELAHIKDGDYAFKAMTNALVAISFFNPLSYFAASEAMKEREMLADERGASALPNPSALASALVKVGTSLKGFPPERRLMRLVAATFLVSSFELRSKASSHNPSVEVRAWNVLELGSRSVLPKRRLAAAVAISAIILIGGVGASLCFLDLQAHMLQVLLPKAPLAFSYASQSGTNGVTLRAAHSGANEVFPRWEGPHFGSRAALRPVNTLQCHAAHPVLHT
jgi:Zn-dependent protease with chaperone function